MDEQNSLPVPQNNTFEIRFGDALREAWGLFMKGPEVFVSLTFLGFASLFVLTGLPVVGQMISYFLMSMLPAAFYLVADSGYGKERIGFESLQKLMTIAPQLLALGLAKSVLITLGFMFLVLPGIYVMTVLSFAELFLVLQNKPFVEAMKESQRLVHQNFWGVLGLMCLSGMLTLSGLFLVLIGLLVTFPLAILLLYCVFRRVSVRVIQ